MLKIIEGFVLIIFLNPLSHTISYINIKMNERVSQKKNKNKTKTTTTTTKTHSFLFWEISHSKCPV